MKRNARAHLFETVEKMNIGSSVVVSGLFSEVDDCSKMIGIRPHTVEFSLGIFGKKALLPNKELLQITTMCGHLTSRAPNKKVKYDMAFDDIAPIYDETRTVPNWVLNEFYERTLKKEIRLNTNLVILDAGIGTGRTVGPLLDLDIYLVGVDISKKMLQKFTEKLRGRAVTSQISLVLGDVTQLPFRNCSFDIVIAVHLLGLLKNCKQAIRETKRVLKPKNSFIVASHNQPELETRLGQTYLEILLNTVHERSDPKKILRRILKVLGTKRMKPLKRILESVSTPDNWHLYLKRQARSRETYTIRWKERIGVSTIADWLEKRFLSIQAAMSTEDCEKLIFKLNKWRNEKMRNNPFLEIMREFTYIKVQF